MITKQTAALLYGHSYQLQDSLGHIGSIYQIDGETFYCDFNSEEHKIREVDFTSIGQTYFIRCRPYDQLTKPMENGEVPIVEIGKLCGYKSLQRSEDDGVVSYGFDQQNYDDCQGYEFAYSESLACFGLWYDCKDDDMPLHITYDKSAMELFHDLHFKPSALTNEMCVWI